LRRGQPFAVLDGNSKIRSVARRLLRAGAMMRLLSILIVSSFFACGAHPSTDGTLGAQCRYGNTVPQNNGVPVGKPALDPCRSGLQCCGNPDTDGYCVESTGAAEPSCPAR
jgi:hypothetical protein